MFINIFLYFFKRETSVMCHECLCGCAENVWCAKCACRTCTSPSFLEKLRSSTVCLTTTVLDFFTPKLLSSDTQKEAVGLQKLTCEFDDRECVIVN